LCHFIEQAYTELPNPKDSLILIGEVLIPDAPFHITNGILNRSIGNCEATDAVFYLHDLITPENKLAINRYNTLVDFLPNNTRTFKRIEPLVITEFNEKLWYNIFDKQVELGEEGIVAKRLEAYYSAGKRNSDLLKLKLEASFDCLAIRLEESIGEKGEKGLTLVSKRANGMEVRTIISRHKDQELFRADSSNIIGKVVEVKAMEELEDGQLRQAVFKYVREDKHIEDIN
jgi:ATP-dependent DNA ligase